METQPYTNKNSGNTALKYGVLIGIAGIAFSVLSLVIPSSLSFIMTILSIVVTIGILYKGLIYHRDNELGGAITFGQGFGFGMIAGLIGSLLKSVILYFVTKPIDPELKEELLAEQLEAMENSGLDQNMTESIFGMVESFTTPIMVSTLSFFMYIIWGVIVSLILAAIVKKDPNRDIVMG